MLDERGSYSFKPYYNEISHVSTCAILIAGSEPVYAKVDKIINMVSIKNACSGKGIESIPLPFNRYTYLSSD